MKSIAPVLEKRVCRGWRWLKINARMFYAQAAIWPPWLNPDFLVIGAARLATSWMHK